MIFYRNKAHLSILLPWIISLLLLTGCDSNNRYVPLGENLDTLLSGGSALDTAFVDAITAPDLSAFRQRAEKFMAIYHADVEPDVTFAGFNPETSCALMQDTLLFYMQDYLLNDYRYHESLQLGAILGRRLSSSSPSDLHSASLNDMAVANFYLGNIDKAIKFQKAGYEIDWRDGDPELLSSDLNQLAAMCLRADKYDLARDYILEAIHIEQPLDRPAVLAIRYGLASEIYLKLGDYATAKDYASKALDLDRKEGRAAKVGVRLSQLAAIQMAEHSDADAEQSLAEALPLLKAADNVNSLAIANCQLGELALRRGASPLAQQYYYEALLLCRQTGLKPVEKRALQGLWLTMKRTNPVLGAEYLERYTALSDSLGRADSDSQLANLKAEYATRELQIDNERLAAQNRSHCIILITCGAMLVLLCLIGWLIYRNRSSRQRLMQQMEQVRMNFFTNITHEFRTPLTVILGLSNELKKNESTREQAEIITQEGHDLLDLVNQLLDIGKVSSSIGRAQWRHGNIVGYLNMLVESLRPLAVAKNVELVFSPASNDIEMDFVPDYIRKIVRNILSNALKYTQAEGRVLISARADNGKLLLRIADNGRGIDSADIEHIFEPFYQGTNSKTSVGTGVGLSLVRLLVKAMNGDISVKSRNGIGSVFILSLPMKHVGDEVTEEFDGSYMLEETPQEVLATPEQSEADEDRSRPVVLIVEDNINVANYISAQLAGHYDTHIAHNGEEGLARASNIVPDLIITDVMMPLMDGIEFVKRLRENDILNHLPVVMVTARASDKDRIEGVSSGADAYISKPFNADELRAVAANLIRQRRMLCEKYRMLAQSQVAASDDIDAKDRAFLGQFINVIYRLISEGLKTDIQEIANRMNLSERSLTRKVQALTGEATVAFVNRVKIDKAKRALESDNTSSLAEISMHCGFDDPAYFSRIFKQIVGESPTTYRRHIR